MLTPAEALAMATPVRTCFLTHLRLPEYFHLDFGLQSHPVTGAPWHLPRLAVEKKSKNSNKRQALEDSSPKATSADHQNPSDSCTSQTNTSESKSLRTLSATYLPARAPALRYISKLKRKHYLRLLIPRRWKEGDAVNTDEIVWRKDMDLYVLSLMRTDVIKRLSYLSSRPSGYIVRCDDWGRINQHHQVGAILWIGDLMPRKDFSGADSHEVDDQEPRTSEQDKGPPPYAMVFYRQHHIPVYNLPFLLGNPRLHTLCKGSVSFKGTLALIKQKHNTVDLQLALWKLMGYLAPDD